MARAKAPESDLRRRVPPVDQLLLEPAVQALVGEHGRALVLRELRGLLEHARAAAGRGDAESLETLLSEPAAELARRVAQAVRPSLRPLINATGVVVHTNLGRAPLPRAAAERVARLAAAYSNLEYDLAAGERGNREVHAETRLRAILGCEATTVVNNNAAAVLLAVNTFAEGKDVVVSRGELVEIGGSFRIPEVLEKGGARLKEVGTTNRTRVTDYRAALTGEVGLILKVHPSNFRIEGFTEAPALDELVALGHEAGIPVLEDLGSGLLVPFGGALDVEPSVEASLRAGVDVVTFSGDKVLGGPQAGLVAGRHELIGAMRRNPLYRALRVDKMTLAALDAVLTEHEAGRARQTVPVHRMLAETAESVGRRAAALAETLRTACLGLEAELQPGASAVGGGAAPTTAVPTTLLALRHPTYSAARLAADLRAGEPPVVARIAEDRLILDLRTVAAEEEAALRKALVAVLATP